MRYLIPKQFDGLKFANRYGLKSYPNKQFWIERGELVLADNIKLPDDPPVFEISDNIKPKTLEERLKELEIKLGG